MRNRHEPAGNRRGLCNDMLGLGYIYFFISPEVAPDRLDWANESVIVNERRDAQSGLLPRSG